MHKFFQSACDVTIICICSLSAQLYAAGFQNIVNVDISEVCIAKMQRQCQSMPRMKWMVADCTWLSLPSNSFDVVWGNFFICVSSFLFCIYFIFCFIGKSMVCFWVWRIQKLCTNINSEKLFVGITKTYWETGCAQLASQTTVEWAQGGKCVIVFRWLSWQPTKKKIWGAIHAYVFVYMWL